MSRFVLLSSLFLAWGFYELSGGRDFDPAVERQARLDERTARQERMAARLTPPPVETAAVRASESGPLLASTPAPVSADLRRSTAPALREEHSPQLFQVNRLPLVRATAPAPVNVVASTPAGEAINTAVRASNETGAEGQTGLTPLRRIEEQPAPDLRHVRPSRANLRMGPGTRYNIVARLDRSTEVNVLQDPGNGWVKLKVVSSGRIGWMSAKLLDKPVPDTAAIALSD